MVQTPLTARRLLLAGLAAVSAPAAAPAFFFDDWPGAGVPQPKTLVTRTVTPRPKTDAEPPDSNPDPGVLLPPPPLPPEKPERPNEVPEPASALAAAAGLAALAAARRRRAG